MQRGCCCRASPAPRRVSVWRAALQLSRHYKTRTHSPVLHAGWGVTPSGRRFCDEALVTGHRCCIEALVAGCRCCIEALVDAVLPWSFNGASPDAGYPLVLHCSFAVPRGASMELRRMSSVLLWSSADCRAWCCHGAAAAAPGAAMQRSPPTLGAAMQHSVLYWSARRRRRCCEFAGVGATVRYASSLLAAERSAGRGGCKIKRRKMMWALRC